MLKKNHITLFPLSLLSVKTVARPPPVFAPGPLNSLHNHFINHDLLSLHTGANSPIVTIEVRINSAHKIKRW